MRMKTRKPMYFNALRAFDRVSSDASFRQRKTVRGEARLRRGSALPGVGVSVECCLNISVPHDALKGLDVKERRGNCGKSVAKDVCRHIVEDDGAGNAAHVR